MLVDCDHLKHINDVHGHLSGDRALQALSDVMKITLRETDVLARLGGDEFAALLVEADEERAIEVCQRLRRTVQTLRLISEDGGDIDMTISAGIAVFPDDGGDVKSLLRGADMALYRAKDDGRNQAVASGRRPPGEEAPEGDAIPEIEDIDDWPTRRSGGPLEPPE